MRLDGTSRAGSRDYSDAGPIRCYVGLNRQTCPAELGHQLPTRSAKSASLFPGLRSQLDLFDVFFNLGSGGLVGAGSDEHCALQRLGQAGAQIKSGPKTQPALTPLLALHFILELQRIESDVFAVRRMQRRVPRAVVGSRYRPGGTRSVGWGIISRVRTIGLCPVSVRAPAGAARSLCAHSLWRGSNFQKSCRSCSRCGSCACLSGRCFGRGRGSVLAGR